MIADTLHKSLTEISELFETMHGENASNWQVQLVHNFRVAYPELNDDLDFCFEVLAGKHKLGFTVREVFTFTFLEDRAFYTANSIKDLYDTIVELTANNKSEYITANVCAALPAEFIEFFINLFNRVYKLGYSNRKNMVTNLHCMLAKSYPAGVTSIKQYYIQEKLNGNRCIAWFDEDQAKWRFTSRSQKEKSYPFDMSQLDPAYVYDGEVLSRNAMGNRDFSKTSGLANSKYGDKSQLVYVIYDILDSTMSYKDRWAILSQHCLFHERGTDERLVFDNTAVSDNVAILPLLGKITVYPNTNYNYKLDAILDYITDQGGEGIMLRDPDAPYYHSSGSGDRKNYLLKYKKTKTCDLRIIGWNNGKGKYDGMIGSFICEDDDHTVLVNVAGIDDDIRASNPELWIGNIIEVAYFEGSQSKTKTTASLQFPRYKRIRPDKTETSLE